MSPRNEPRRPNLATIVGSSLAVAAAGSLIAFSSLAEQAGLQGLSIRGIQPAQPGHGGGGGHAITVPAPSTAPPGEPRDALTQLVRDTIERDVRVAAPQPVRVVEFDPAPAPRKRDRRLERPETQPRVAVATPDETGEVETAEWDGPPYGHAYGHYKNKHDAKPKAPKKKPAPKVRTKDQPVYARTAADDKPGRGPKPPKTNKLEKVDETPGNGNGNGKAKAKGHSKHSHGNGKGKSKGKGHSKHGG